MADQAQQFYHLRILLGLVLALGITRILAALPNFVQHGREKPVSAAHLFWIATVLLMAIHFWWFQHGLAQIQIWRFERYIFVLSYAFLFFLMATLLVPEDLGEHRDYEAYFMSRRRAFFVLLAATVPVDLIDTLLKGTAYFRSQGLEYPIRLAFLLVLCVIALWTENRRFHLIFAAAYLAYFVSWILRLNDVLN